MDKRFVILSIITVCLLGIALYMHFYNPQRNVSLSMVSLQTSKPEQELNPLSIEYMRKQEYPGSEITIEETLAPGSNYNRYIASYKSDGYKIYALLTIPKQDPIASLQDDNHKYPVIIFNHGYIPPAQYNTTERYVAYADAFSRNGYIVFKPDYRGHGKSEGNPEGAYYSPAYTRDVLNALASVKKLKNPSEVSSHQLVVDSSHIGMWGHSMGGNITLRSLVVDPKDIKAAVIWAGVVADYKDLAVNWHRATPFVPSEREQAARRNTGRQTLIDKYGDFDKNLQFWHSIAPIYFVKDITAPIQIHHATTDEEVPLLFSERLVDVLKEAKKPVEFYAYPGDDHNISQNLSLALQRSVEFFDKYLK